MSLLKPHGSLDWAQCPECGQLVLLCHHQPFDVYRRLPYSACGVGERMHPVIQMPHQGSLPVLGDVLRRTERAVHAANHIVVIGYSFPEYDMHTRGLFRQALRVGATRWRSPHQTGWFRGVSTGDPAGIGRGGGVCPGWLDRAHRPPLAHACGAGGKDVPAGPQPVSSQKVSGPC